MHPVADSPLRAATLAFLAERSPGAYTAAVIAARVARSGMLDGPTPTEADAQTALRLMAEPRFAWVDAATDNASGDICWFATEAGRRRWALDGQMHVG